MCDEEEMRFASAQAGLFDTAARCMRRPDAGLAAEIIAGSLTRRFGSCVPRRIRGSPKRSRSLRRSSGRVLRMSPGR